MTEKSAAVLTVAGRLLEAEFTEQDDRENYFYREYLIYTSDIKLILAELESENGLSRRTAKEIIACETLMDAIVSRYTRSKYKSDMSGYEAAVAAIKEELSNAENKHFN